jgi:hypothetical protein
MWGLFTYTYSVQGRQNVRFWVLMAVFLRVLRGLIEVVFWPVGCTEYV